MRKRLTPIAKKLRESQTEAEKLLWKYLRRKQLEELKFRRQQPIGNYIVDFVNFEKKIIIEIDGGQHALNREKDKTRDKWFEAQGYIVLRFWDNEIFGNIEGRDRIWTPGRHCGSSDHGGVVYQIRPPKR